MFYNVMDAIGFGMKCAAIGVAIIITLWYFGVIQ